MCQTNIYVMVAHASVFLDEIGFRYYLPAYMIWFVTSIVHLLVFADESEEREFDLEKERSREAMLADGYSQADIDKAVEYANSLRLQYAVPENSARHALESYWNKFL
jgi:hypothetical protein